MKMRKAKRKLYASPSYNPMSVWINWHVEQYKKSGIDNPAAHEELRRRLGWK